MKNIMIQFKTHFRMHLLGKTIKLLLATLLTVGGLQLPLYAGTNQLLFDMDAVTDSGSLAVKLQDTRAPVSKSIADRLSENTQWLLIGYDGASNPSSELQKALLEDLNRLIETGSLYDVQLFADIQLSEETQTLIAQNPQSGEALVRLNRSLLADVYPHELASISGRHTLEDSIGIEVCRENLRQIKLARENYQSSNADTDPQWLSELSPEYLEEKMLLCPADATAGKPGVLTEGAVDPTLPCSYLYEIRPSEKTDQEILWADEGGMTPIVRCEHHYLNLSLNGKLYRNGPQRSIYTSNKMGMTLLRDFVADLRTQHGEAFLKTQEGRAQLKQATEELILNKLVPRILSAMKKEVVSQLEAQLGKNILNTPMGMDIFKQVFVQMGDAIEEQLLAQLQAQLGEEFFQTPEGQDIHQQLSALMSP